MAFLHCKFCSFTGNGARFCPDCDVPMVSDEVSDVDIKVVVSDEMARIQGQVVGSALLAVHEAALGVVDSLNAEPGPDSMAARYERRNDYVLVHKDHLKTLECAVKMARAEITGLVFDGGKPCE